MVGSPTADVVSLTWTAVTGADSYKIYYSTSKTFTTYKNASASNIPTDGLTHTTTANTSTTTKKLDGNRWYFMVTSFNNGVESYTSTPISIVPFATVQSPFNTATYGGSAASVTWTSCNLGAISDASYSTQTTSYDDLYQWGRAADGHERIDRTTKKCLNANDNKSACSNSEVMLRSSAVGTLTITTNPHKFIATGSNSNGDWTSVDESGVTRTIFLKLNDGKGICPKGFGVPTKTELAADTTSNGVTNTATAIINFLKLPAAGYRSGTSAKLTYVGIAGLYWSSEVSSNTKTFRLRFETSATTNSINRNHGYSIRCIKSLG